MKIQIALNTIVHITLLIKSCSSSKKTKESTNYSSLKNIKINESVDLSDNYIVTYHNKSDFKSLQLNKSKHSEDTHKTINTKQNKIKPIKNLKTKYFTPRRKTNSTLKPKVTNKLRTSRGNKQGKVFEDTREDYIQYKLLDDMMFKPLDSNRSVSITFSDESEITQTDVDRAIEGKDSSCIAIPIKRKKDIYKEFLRWAHVHEKNERRAEIEREVKENYMHRTKHLNINQTDKNKNQIYLQSEVNVFSTKNNYTESSKKSSHFYNISSQNVRFNQLGNQSSFTATKENLTTFKKNAKHLNQNLQTTKLKNIKQQVRVKNKDFKVESVELQYDPDFLNKLQKSMKDQAEKSKKKGRKKKLKKQKQRQTYEGNPADISAEDYSAQEMFMMNTQKEAMGRRFYQMFVNKTASDFWDNNTLETTKMLEFLIPLGEHLHKTLEKPPPNDGNNFVTNLQMYKAELVKFIALVKKDKAETRPDVVALLEEPYEHVCETKYSQEEIKIMFGWDEKEFEQFEKLLGEIKEIWFDLQLFHHCYQFVSESAESYYSDQYQYNYTKDEIDEIIKNNTWLPS